jgi:peptide/nickel transport system substrate-binding protein
VFVTRALKGALGVGRVLKDAALVSAVLVAAACGDRAARRGATVLYASGADLQSINPLLTVHPLARQVQKFVLLTTLARYDSALVPRPYLARAWSWSADRRRLTLALRTDVRWHDDRPTTAHDVAWTLSAARDPVVGYPRLTDLADLRDVRPVDDSTVILDFATPQPAFPDVLTDLAVLPAHLLDTVPHAGLRRAAWNERPVGNGPFHFVDHRPNRRWAFARHASFPAALGARPAIERLIIVVVDEPTTKLAALTAGELDVAGINPAHAAFVARDPRLLVRSYPLLFTYGLVFNTRRPPFDVAAVRRAAALAVDRQEIVDGYLFGFGVPATGPVPPDVPGALEAPDLPHDPAAARRLLGGRRVALELLTVGSGEAALEQMLQARLAAAGFDVAIRQLELTAFLDRVYGTRHDFTAAVMGIPGDPALGYLRPLAVLTGMRADGDAATLQRRFADSLPVAFLYHGRGLQGLNRRLEGVVMDVRGELVSITEWRVRE